MARLQDHYKEKVVPALVEKFGYKSVMQVPRIEKITINMGVGEAVGDKKNMQYAVDDMTMISGQHPIVTKARKSVAGFKIREGWPIGCKVTLRRERMYEFLDRLINIALTRWTPCAAWTSRSPLPHCLTKRGAPFSPISISRSSNRAIRDGKKKHVGQRGEAPEDSSQICCQTRRTQGYYQ